MNKDFDSIWEEFTESFEFFDLKGYPKKSTKSLLEKLFELMSNENMTEWDKNNIFDILMKLAKMFDRLKRREDDDTLKLFYNVVSAFLQFASRAKLLSIPISEIDELLGGLEDKTEFGKYVSPLEVNRLNFNLFDQIDLPEWNESVMMDAIKQVNGWVKEYVKSSDWEKRSNGVTEDILRYSMSKLTGNIYDDYRQIPATWTGDAIENTITGSFVSDVSFPLDEYKNIVPGLLGFFTFAGEKGWFSQIKIDNFERHLSVGEVSMIEFSTDESRFSDSKLLRYKAAEFKAEHNNDESIDYYAEISNMGGADALRAGISVDTKEPTKKQIETLAKLLDMEADQYYLKTQHTYSFNSRNWNKDDAVSVHQLGLQYGVELWFKREKYNLTIESNLEIFLIKISGVVDSIYAIRLEYPAQWDLETWKAFSKTENHAYSSIEKDIKLFIALIKMLSDKDLISREFVKSVIMTNKSNSIHGNSVRRVKGKVLKKKKKRKKRK